MHIVSSPGEYFTRFAVEEGVFAHPLRMQRRITPLTDLIVLARMTYLLRKLKPAVVHASTPKGGLLGTIAAQIARVPVVIYHVRGLPFVNANGAMRWLLRLTERISCSFADYVLCVSASVRKEVVANALAPLEKTRMLLDGSSNGVAAESTFNPDRFPRDERARLRRELRIPEDAVVIGFVGRLAREKGVAELLDAWRSLAEKHRDLHLLCVGWWENRDPVPSGVKTFLEEHPNAHLVGEQSDVARFYLVMDVVALPTYREGFPNVPLEAAAMRLPVVTTSALGSTDSVVDGVTGLLVPPRDPSALEIALGRYIADPDLRVAHGSAGRERVLKSFRPERIWKELAELYIRSLENVDPGTAQFLAAEKS